MRCRVAIALRRPDHRHRRDIEVERDRARRKTEHRPITRRKTGRHRYNQWRCRGGGKHGQELRAGHNHVHLRFRHAKRVLETALQCVIQADEGMFSLKMRAFLDIVEDMRKKGP